MRRKSGTPFGVSAALALLLAGVQAGAWGAARDAAVPPADRPTADHARVEAAGGAGTPRTQGVRARTVPAMSARSAKTTRGPSGRVAPGPVTVLRDRVRVLPGRAASARAPAFRPSAAAPRLQVGRVAARGRPRAAATAVLGGPATRDPRHGDGVIGSDLRAGPSSPRR